MYGIKYTYAVKIYKDSNILLNGPLSKALPNCNEMVITSKIFDDYLTCEQSLANVLTSLTRYENILCDKNYVIVTAKKPENKENTEGWDDITLLKSYVADSVALKKSELKYTIAGQITIDEKHLNAIKSLAQKTIY